MTSFRHFFPGIIGISTLLLGLVATPGPGTPAGSTSGESVTYEAELMPINSEINEGDATGEATFTVSGDELTISLTVNGVSPDIQHLQHFHGFPDSDDAAMCPTMDDDTNGDGVVDILETAPAAGTTMVPFTDDPVSMEVFGATYPTADAEGSYTYEHTVSLSELESAMGEQFPGQELNLENRVVFIHTVPETAELPDTVESKGGAPAYETVPVACGEIRLVGDGTPEATPAS